MKKLILTALTLAMVLALLAGCAGGKTNEPKNRLEKIIQSGKLVMATSPDFAPNEFIDYRKTGQEQYVGADVTLGKYIAEKLGVKLEIQAMDFTAVQAAVTTGTVDLALSGFAWTEERAESMGLSDPFNYETDDDGHGLIIPAAKANELTTAESFAGLTVAAQAASLQLGFCEKQLPESVNIQLISNLADAIMMLKTGKVDAVASAHGTGELLIQNEPDYTFSQFFFDYSSDGTVVAMNKADTELVAKVNEILAQAKEEGVLPVMYTEAKALAQELGVE